MCADCWVWNRKVEDVRSASSFKICLPRSLVMHHMTFSEQNALVSCIMPTAGRRQFVPQAIRNFLAQDYAERELVILDDGADSVADLVPGDSRIHHVRTNQMQTLGAKRNECIRVSRGELIMHWDDDDWSASHRISYQVETLLRERAELCGLRQMLFYNPTTSESWLYTYPANARLWLAGGSLLYTREFWQQRTLSPTFRLEKILVSSGGRLVHAWRWQKISTFTSRLSIHPIQASRTPTGRTGRHGRRIFGS